MNTRGKTILLAVVVLATVATPLAAFGERVKDITDIKGIRSNPLWGYGIVVGLNGTGDNSPASRRALTNMLRRSGLTLSPDDLTSKNIASVLVTAELPPFARNGSTIDLTLSSIGSCSSLQGGTLLLTELKGADGQVYAVGQGPISLGGWSASGESATVTKNHTTVARIPNGANVEREEIATFIENGEITFQIRNNDFATADAIAKAVNGLYADSAFAPDSVTVRVRVPEKLTKAQIAGFVEKLGALDVKVDIAAMVVINERTGTVVVGENVAISTVAISHGNLSIITAEKDFVSQPSPMSKGGETEKVHRTDISATEEKGALRVMQRQVTVAELARALNAMGLSPRDLIAIFEALRQAGALQAQLKIM